MTGNPTVDSIAQVIGVLYAVVSIVANLLPHDETPMGKTGKALRRVVVDARSLSKKAAAATDPDRDPCAECAEREAKREADAQKDD